MCIDSVRRILFSYQVLEMFANMLIHKSAWTMCFSGWHLWWTYNTFNLKVQGKDKSVVDPHSAVKSFGSKLLLSRSDIYAAMLNFSLPQVIVR